MFYLIIIIIIIITIIIIIGIFALYFEEVRKLMDLMLFIDTV